MPLTDVLDQWPAANDDAVKRWTNALASRLEVMGDCVYIDRQHVEECGSAPESFAAMLELTAEGAVLNACGPGYGKQVSRFLDLLPPEMLEEQRAMNRARRGARVSSKSTTARC